MSLSNSGVLRKSMKVENVNMTQYTMNSYPKTPEMHHRISIKSERMFTEDTFEENFRDSLLESDESSGYQENVQNAQPKIILLVPEGFESCIEVRSVSSSTATDYNSSGTASTSSSSQGPIRSSSRYKRNRNLPYYSSRYGRQRSRSIKESSVSRDSTHTSARFNRTKELEYPRNANNYNDNASHFTRSTNFNSNSRRPVNLWDKQARRCWNCYCDSHLYRRCRLPQYHTFCRRCGCPNTITRNCENCKSL